MWQINHGDAGKHMWNKEDAREVDNLAKEKTETEKTINNLKLKVGGKLEKNSFVLRGEKEA